MRKQSAFSNIGEKAKDKWKHGAVSFFMPSFFYLLTGSLLWGGVIPLLLGGAKEAIDYLMKRNAWPESLEDATANLIGLGLGILALIWLIT